MQHTVVVPSAGHHHEITPASMSRPRQLMLNER